MQTGMRVRRFTTGKKGDVDKVTMGIAHVGLHAAQAEHHVGIALAGELFGGIQPLLQGDAKTGFQQHGVVALTSQRLSQLEILDVGGADLQHHPDGIAGVVPRVVDLGEMALMGHLHGDDANALFSRQLEYVGEAAAAVALEGVGVGARLVGPHAGAVLAVLLQRAHHPFHMLWGVYRAETGEDVEAVLAEVDALVLEAAGALVVAMEAEDAILSGDLRYPLHAGQAVDRRIVELSGVADQIELVRD